MTKRETSDDNLTAERREELKTLLTEKRAALAKPKGPRLGDARGDQPDIMDAATDATDDDEKILLSERDRALIHEIDDALARIADGSYGESERSGEPIGYARLRAVPWARLTVREAEEDERRQR